jgi:hypothetical protein
MWWVGEWAWRVLGLRTVPLHHMRHDTVYGSTACSPIHRLQSPHVVYGALLAALGL